MRGVEGKEGKHRFGFSYILLVVARPDSLLPVGKDLTKCRSVLCPVPLSCDGPAVPGSFSL